jgi:hypothetical protein
MELQHKVEVVGGESTWKDQDAVSCKLDRPVIFMIYMRVSSLGRGLRSFTSYT